MTRILRILPAAGAAIALAMLGGTAMSWATTGEQHGCAGHDADRMRYDLCGITSGTPGSVTVTVPAVKVRLFERNGAQSFVAAYPLHHGRATIPALPATCEPWAGQLDAIDADGHNVAGHQFTVPPGPGCTPTSTGSTTTWPTSSTTATSPAPTASAPSPTSTPTGTTSTTSAVPPPPTTTATTTVPASPTTTVDIGTPTSTTRTPSLPVSTPPPTFSRPVQTLPVGQGTWTRTSSDCATSPGGEASPTMSGDFCAASPVTSLPRTGLGELWLIVGAILAIAVGIFLIYSPRIEAWVTKTRGEKR
jgi:hypothetical protein